MTTEQVSLQELQNWDYPENIIKQLEKFREVVQKSDVKIEEVWLKYSLLPKQAIYLVASHHRYERCGWAMMTKWQIVKEFDKELRKGPQLSKVLAAIDSAIATEKKIVALEKIFGIYKNESLESSLKDKAIQIWQKENRELADEVTEKMNVVCQYFMLLRPGVIVNVPPTDVVEKMLFSL